MKMRWVVVLLLLCVGCAGGPAQEQAGGLAVNEAWARPGLADGNSAVYFVIDNRQGAADTLLSASCDAAMMTEVHATKMDADGNMQMEHQKDGVPVPAGEQVAFEPGGLHVMLMQLKKEVVPGDVLTVTLRFAQAGEVTVQAAAREP